MTKQNSDAFETTTSKNKTDSENDVIKTDAKEVNAEKINVNEQDSEALDRNVSLRPIVSNDLNLDDQDSDKNGAHQSKQKKYQARIQAKSLLLKLAEEYPQIFPKAGTGRPVVLAIGLHKHLLPIAKEWGFDGITVRSALSWYTKQLRYQRALAHAEFRTNLDGSQAESITEEQKTHALSQISETQKWIAAHKPEKSNVRLDRKKTTSAKHLYRAKSTENGAPKNEPQKAAESENSQIHKPAKTHRPAARNSQHKTVAAKETSQTAANSARTSKTSPSKLASNLSDKLTDLIAKFNQH